MIQPAEKMQIFPARKPGVEAEIGSRVVTKLAAHRRSLPCRVVTRDKRPTPSRKEQSGEDTKQRGLSGAVRAEQRHRFARVHLQGNASKRRLTWRRERLKERAPAAVSSRKEFF